MPWHRVPMRQGYTALADALMCRHCEEQGDEAISRQLILTDEIAALRSQ